MEAPAPLELRPDNTGLVLVDIQERLCAAMPSAEVARASRSWIALIEMAGRLRLPVAVSEQYPKGLGPTLLMIREVAGKLSPPPRFVEKLDFSCCDVPLFAQYVEDSGRRNWIIAGMETHVCVYQTARGLRQRGLEVHVASDAVLSRTRANWEVGLGLMERAGCVISSTEAALFDLVRRAEGEQFKALSRLIR